MHDLISRQAAIDYCYQLINVEYQQGSDEMNYGQERVNQTETILHHLELMPSVQPDSSKYEYHYDHTDCIWYRPEARNRCPSTCAQYRDGWNDAMNYIFRDGKGYRPYRRDKQYGE